MEPIGQKFTDSVTGFVGTCTAEVRYTTHLEMRLEALVEGVVQQVWVASSRCVLTH